MFAELKSFVLYSSKLAASILIRSFGKIKYYALLYAILTLISYLVYLQALPLMRMHYYKHVNDNDDSAKFLPTCKYVIPNKKSKQTGKVNMNKGP
jgi:hypothetical protein